MRILVATDQPFWLRRGGAHERIASLLLGLENLGSWEIGIYYLGDRRHLEQLRDTEFGSRVVTSPLPGQSLWHRCLSWLKNRSGPNGHLAVEGGDHSPGTKALRLEDYRWPWVIPKFQKFVQRWQPDVILMEYITMTYLKCSANGLRSVWVVDTHDVLSQRCRLFQQQGQTHWLDINESEEVAAMSVADLLIAIQADEADWMRERLPDTSVIVCGHYGGVSPEERSQAVRAGDNKELRFGLLGSDNYPNQTGLRFLQNEVWPAIGGTVGQSAQIWLAGQLAHNCAVSSDWQLVGPVEHLRQFYRQVDVVLNPINVGTGLKIKSAEALAWGKPLLAFPHGVSGLDGIDTADANSCFQAGIVVCRSAEQWRKEMQRLATDTKWRMQLQQQAQHWAESHFSIANTYGPLNQTLQRMVELNR